MTDLLDETIAAHGGRRRWAQLSGISVHTRGSGALWALKQQRGVFADLDVAADTHRQHVSFSPFLHDGWRGVFEPDRVRVENADGMTEMDRHDPRASFAGHDMRTPWDPLHALYFGGYAMWTYLTAPFLFLEPGVAVTEGEPWTENDQTWRRLHVTFPGTIATHSAEQVFYIDADGLIRRHDYTAEVVGGAGGAAHYLHGHADVDGIVFPTLRKVHIRQPDNRAAAEPILIEIELDRYRLW
jgi:hypothetical protein